MANLTRMTDFILMGFSEIHEIQSLHAILFLLIYMTALLGNILIITLTSVDQRLSTPMYFFLKHLSLLDSLFISVTVPKSIINSLTHTRTMSFLGCAIQLFFILYLPFSELVLLTVMAYDPYVAICRPLHYEAIMNRKVCVYPATASWFSGGIGGGMYTSSTFSLTFCSFLIQQFFCDVPSLLKISCIGTNIAKNVITAIIFFLALGCFTSIIVSYTYIFHTVLRIPSAKGRSKSFSICLPHLFVIILFFSTGTTPYLVSTSDISSLVGVAFSVFYTVMPPNLNPMIAVSRIGDQNRMKRGGSTLEPTAQPETRLWRVGGGGGGVSPAGGSREAEPRLALPARWGPGHLAVV